MISSKIRVDPSCWSGPSREIEEAEGCMAGVDAVGGPVWSLTWLAFETQRGQP